MKPKTGHNEPKGQREKRYKPPADSKTPVGPKPHGRPLRRHLRAARRACAADTAARLTTSTVHIRIGPYGDHPRRNRNKKRPNPTPPNPTLDPWISRALDTAHARDAPETPDQDDDPDLIDNIL